jgi:hypothetical protein
MLLPFLFQNSKKKMLLEFQIGLVSELWPMIGLSMNYALLPVTLKVLRASIITGCKLAKY